MYRKELIRLLLDNPMGISELARLLGVPYKEVEEDLSHLQKTLRASEYRMTLDPGWCRSCQFVFRKAKLRKPGKCPRCRSTWTREPKIGIEQSGRLAKSRRRP